MSERLTKKEKDFADSYLKTGNATKSALESYNTENENTAAVIGSQNLRKYKIIQYLEENASDAAGRIVEISKKARSEAVKLKANNDILDRTLGKPITPMVGKVQHEHTIYDEIQIEE